jgi:hypothetical protein
MQNRYAGDLGDYAKCGLLRALCADDLHLGMVWYLSDDETHNNDGRHRPPAEMRECDPAMFDAFRTIGRRRSVARLQQIDAWPSRCTFFDEPLTWANLATGNRRTFRGDWVRRAVAATGSCDMICVDPDNGLEVASVKRTAKTGPKYAFIDELQPYWQRGQSLVIYQHAHRQASVAVQAAGRIAQLTDAFGRRVGVRAVRFRRGTSRLFLITMQPKHRQRLSRRLDSLLAGPWAEHFQTCP